jgi:phage shock protein C
MEPGPEITPAPPPAPPPAPQSPRRLTRSSRERMWAGVAGGMAEYFDLDPSLVRLIWVAAAVVSHGLAIPLYILAWIILPRDDRPPADSHVRWRDWSQEFHAETQRLAQEARRVADEFQTSPTTPQSDEPKRTPASSKADAPAPEPPAAQPQPWGPTTTWPSPAEPAPTWSSTVEPAPTWSAPSDIEQPRSNGGSRGVGIVLVGLGALLLAANAGWFAWFSWSTMWPLIFIGLGVILLARQFDWWGR